MNSTSHGQQRVRERGCSGEQKKRFAPVHQIVPVSEGSKLARKKPAGYVASGPSYVIASQNGSLVPNVRLLTVFSRLISTWSDRPATCARTPRPIG